MAKQKLPETPEETVTFIIGQFNFDEKTTIFLGLKENLVHQAKALKDDGEKAANTLKIIEQNGH